MAHNLSIKYNVTCIPKDGIVKYFKQYLYRKSDDPTIDKNAIRLQLVPSEFTKTEQLRMKLVVKSAGGFTEEESINKNIIKKSAHLSI